MGEGLQSRIRNVRSFNRFYTREIGVLRESFLDAGFTLPELRVLYEVAHEDGITASQIAERLGMDPGYVSRLVQELKARQLLSRTKSTEDSRQTILRLTKRGEQQFTAQNKRQNEEVEKMLAKIPEYDQRQLVSAMNTVQRILGGTTTSKSAVILREPRLGDMGWVLCGHGEGYADVYGLDVRFEALVARILADFMASRDPAKERAWIAERDGERMGCVFLVRHPEHKDTAKLRLLWVEAAARGLGVGKALVHECTRFAKQAGYKRIVLWTNSVLATARAIYEREGYTLVSEQAEPIFAQGQRAQEWELGL
ncbi:transcriptional regulator, MarR family with acetyltransferase activity [Candidatus Koribacter versatilis Ellin345]|uniref:Transcriptional regulator, MarR family with acetyltransferase activity n=1 Tax=Koribacter versatilis (strain Ellin345) TaxID=204669 RepID=Q1IKZ2_KORVE|nr:transcriptional regulator, MarR family with acetyltransferase activity [Candidatus Koribacter versatilis Ellin345]